MKYNIVYENDEPTSVTMFYQGQMLMAEQSHPNFPQIIAGFREGRPDTEIIELMFDPGAVIARRFDAAARILHGVAEALASLEEPEPDLDIPDWVNRGGEDEPERFDREAEDALLFEHDLRQPYDDKFDVTLTQAPSLVDLNQKGLRVLAKQHGIAFVGKTNDELRVEIARALGGDDAAALYDTSDLQAKNARQLREDAKQYNVTGASKMKKADLVRKIGAARIAAATDVATQVEIKDGRMYLGGEEVHGAIVDAIIAHRKAGNENFIPLVRFLDKVRRNPNKHSREHLYEWMRHLSFRVDDDGDIIAYKSVNREMDKKSLVSAHQGDGIVNGKKYTNTYLPNNPGDVVEMPRDKVTFDPKTHCSVGLHIGTVKYATTQYRKDTMIEVKVNPVDVVSVPDDHQWAKMRVCRYTVVREVKGGVSTLRGVELEEASA